MRTLNRKEIVVFWLITKKLIKATCFSSICRLIREIQIADFLIKMYLLVDDRLDEGSRAFKAVDGKWDTSRGTVGPISTCSANSLLLFWIVWWFKWRSLSPCPLQLSICFCSDCPVQLSLNFLSDCLFYFLS